jgi:hypothetical protein
MNLLLRAVAVVVACILTSIVTLFVDTKWLDDRVMLTTTIKGTQGIQGVPGPIGLQGITGLQGTAGLTGATGNVGPQGIPGVTTIITKTIVQDDDNDKEHGDDK